MSKLIEKTNDKYAKAFISVCEMLEPNVRFSDMNHTTHVCDDGVDISVEVSGKVDEETIVVVSHEKSNIVVRYYHVNDEVTLLKERKVWYFAFNWKGLMATL